MLMIMFSMRCIYSYIAGLTHINMNLVQMAKISYIHSFTSFMMYICDYMTKARIGNSTLIAETCKEAKDGSMTLKQSVCHVTNKLKNTTKPPVMDAYYDIWQFSIIQSSVKKGFIMIHRLDEWMFITKDKEPLQQLNPNSEDDKLSSNTDKYSKRQKY